MDRHNPSIAYILPGVKYWHRRAESGSKLSRGPGDLLCMSRATWLELFPRRAATLGFDER
jgi:hypothetical protein